jgi:hypothetical protein
MQYAHETKLGRLNGGNCKGPDVTGANKITEKPNKQRNEVSSLQNIKHEFEEINLRGLLLRKKRMRHSVRANQHVAGKDACTTEHRSLCQIARDGRQRLTADSQACGGRGLFDG